MTATSVDKNTVKDPVCGMTVDPAKARFSLVFNGTTYYFCSAGCDDKFSADPNKWLVPKSKPSADRAAAVLEAGSPRRSAPAIDTPVRCIRRSDRRPRARVRSVACRWNLYIPSHRPWPNGPVRCTRRSWRPGPGTCPICGMALEPRMPTAEKTENAELRDMSRRFWFSSALTGRARVCWP
jgi:Cu+-exporting ATPase